MEYQKVTLEDGSWVRPLLEATNYKTCEFAFANIYMWAELYHTQIGEYQGYALVRNIGRTHHHFLYPVGGDNLKAVLTECIEDAKAGGKTPMIYSIPESELPRIEAAMPGVFHFGTERKNDDYLYLASDLAELPGKPYQKKRNHVSRFLKEHPDYTFEAISPSNIEMVKEFNRIWGDLYDADNPSLEGEHGAIVRVLDHFFELGLVGGLLRDGDKPLAFCYGSRLNDDVLCTHVEKAYHDVNGAYAIINREFARMYGRDVTYINREDDLGEEGLRKAKLSYRPAMLAKKYFAVLKQEAPAYHPERTEE